MQYKVQAFQEQGYTVLPLQLPHDRIEEICLALEVFRHHPRLQNGYGILQNNAYEKLPILKAALYDYPFGEMACELLQTNEVILFQDNVIWKPQGTTQRIAWHQDYAYWPLSSPMGVTFWIALDDTDVHNGCMQYIPQSHKWNECHPTNFIQDGSPDKASALPRLPIAAHENNAIDIQLSAGQTVAHHPLLAHMSHPNLSNRERRAWSLTWIAPSVRWDPEHAPHPYPIFHPVQKDDKVEGAHFPRFSK